MIKVVRFGLNFLCLPDAHAVELVEKQIARQRERRENEDGFLGRFLPERNCYSLQEYSPWSVEPDRLIGDCLTTEEVKIRIANVSFASAMDPNGWVVSPEKW